jgi:translation initiation factor IF-2
MSETGNSDKTATAAPPKVTLHLKRPVEQGTVRQSFSHGRSKAVVVEKVKRRILTPAEAAAAARPAPAAPAAAPPPVAQDRGCAAHIVGRAA